MDTRFGKLLVRPVDDGLLDENNSKFPNDPFQLFATPSNPVSARQSAHGTTCECWPSSPEAPLALTSTWRRLRRTDQLLLGRMRIFLHSPSPPPNSFFTQTGRLLGSFPSGVRMSTRCRGQWLHHRSRLFWLDQMLFQRLRIRLHFTRQSAQQQLVFVFAQRKLIFKYNFTQKEVLDLWWCPSFRPSVLWKEITPGSRVTENSVGASMRRARRSTTLSPEDRSVVLRTNPSRNDDLWGRSVQTKVSSRPSAGISASTPAARFTRTPSASSILAILSFFSVLNVWFNLVRFYWGYKISP